MGGINVNIKDFESQIDSKILARGREYYKRGYIASLEYDDGEWIADVEGSDNYTVTVSLSDNGDIEDTFCDCPYDWGEHCKHQVAVFFELREKYSKPEGKAQKSDKSDSARKLIRSAINAVSHRGYVE
jgi:uncharacterized Zn finger protein